MKSLLYKRAIYGAAPLLSSISVANAIFKPPASASAMGSSEAAEQATSPDIVFFALDPPGDDDFGDTIMIGDDDDDNDNNIDDDDLKSNTVLMFDDPIHSTTNTQQDSEECTDKIDWIDLYGDGCWWYKQNDERGCPAHGNDGEGSSMGVAADNCCYCNVQPDVSC